MTAHAWAAACVLALALAPARDACAAPPRANAASEPAPFVADNAVEGGLVPKLDPAKLGPPVRRCGWWDNPTPGNVRLTDRDGEWTVAMQGTYEAAGDGPDFARDQAAPKGASHAHGCACMMVRADRASKFVYSIADAKPLALSVCRKDPKLKRKEPEPR